MKEITIYDIAAKLNISAATVSRGLKDHPLVNKKTKKSIIDSAEEMGYRVNAIASNLRNKKSNVIGVIVPRLNSSFMSDVIAGIEKVVNNNHYNLFISQSLETMKKEVNSAKAMLNNRVDGLLVSLAYNTTDIQHFEPFINRGVPVVFFDRVFDHKSCPQIYIDNYKASYEITSHLLKQGCKRIIHITGSLMRNVYAERFNGYKSALAEKNIAFDDALLIVSDLSIEAGIDAAKKILQMQPMPDGVFAANDVCAISCMLELKKNGIKIPNDIAFAGFNNDPSSFIIEPNLTTVNYNGYEMGEAAANLMINQLVNKPELQQTQNLLLKYELIVRQSSVRNNDHSYHDINEPEY